MKILVLSRYERLGASSRVRMLQYIPWLEDHGFSVTVSALFSDKYLGHYYRSGKKSPGEILKSYLARVARLAACGSYDLLWIEKELFPFLPPWGESMLGLFRKPYVVDYDDAVFHEYDGHANLAVRCFLGQKIDAVMRKAALVVAGNDYLADRARLAGAKRVECIPSVIDLKRYQAAAAQTGKMFTIGWIGSPSISYYLKVVEPALAEMCRDGNTRVVLVGAGRLELKGIPFEVIPWSEETEVAGIQTFDAGIMPLPDTPWEWGKCGFKLIQYMACGIPVVASPIGVNTKIVEQGVNGFLADTTDEWVRALSSLRDNSGMRQAMGRAGRVKVEAEYCLQVTAPGLTDLLKGVGRS